MQNITVRKEDIADIKAIDVVHMSAFEGEQEASLIDILRNSSSFLPDLSLVAEFKQRIVGHILLSKVVIQHGAKSTDILALAPMAVVPSQSHRGIGSNLLTAAVDLAKTHNFDAIIVVGHPEFYSRFGFKAASEFGLHCNLPVPDEIVTAMELKDGALGKDGHVIFPSHFESIY